jgi:hypothetical protein
VYYGQWEIRTCEPCPHVYPTPDTVFQGPKEIPGGGVTFRITEVWPTSVCGEIVVSNETSEAAASFRLAFATTNGLITELWGEAAWTNQGDRVIVDRAGWLDPGDSVRLGFCADGTNTLAFVDVDLVLWGVEPLAPRLDIGHGGEGKAVLDWDESAYGYELQRRTNLLSGDWESQVDIYGRTDWTTNLPPDAPATFYRLKTIP